MLQLDPLPFDRGFHAAHEFEGAWRRQLEDLVERRFAAQPAAPAGGELAARDLEHSPLAADRVPERQPGRQTFD